MDCKIMNLKSDYPNWQFIPQAPSSYEIHVTCQIENLGWLLEQLPKPFGIFNPAYKGRIVEVGAFDGVTYSNVWGLLKAGWSGLLIEPMKENADKCREEYKEQLWVEIEQVACSTEGKRTLKMWFEREGSRLATKDDETSEKVKAATLDSLLTKHKFKPNFDLLVIDTENYEQPVLEGFSLDKWKPLLCIIETHHWQRRWIQAYFKKLYRIYSEDGLNSIFVRRDWSPGGEHPSPWPSNVPDVMSP